MDKINCRTAYVPETEEQPVTGRYFLRRNGDRKICEKEKRRQEDTLEGEKETVRYVRRRNGDRKII